jgi:hypothetical protein
MPYNFKSDLPSDIRIPCAQCGRETVHDVLAGDCDNKNGHDVGRQDNDWVMTTLRLVCMCQGCGHKCFANYEDHFSEGESVRVYPPVPIRHVPAWYSIALLNTSWDVLGLLSEIYASLQAGALRLTAAGIRMAFEQIFIEAVGDHGGFAQNLTEFQCQGYLSARQRETINQVIEVGHAAVHRSHLPSKEDVCVMLDILEHTLQSLYVNPETAGRLCPPPRQRRPR